MNTPFQTIHQTNFNPSHLHAFGCLCFPWLKPYTKNKLQSQSTACIFVGYSSSQYAYYCLDPLTNKLYTSRHVTFFYHIFPYLHLMSHNSSVSTSYSHASQPLHHIIPISSHT